MKFELNDLEEEKAKEFKEKHKDCFVQSTIGGQFSYIFTPTGIGYGISIKCEICGEFEDITDYGSW